MIPPIEPPSRLQILFQLLSLIQPFVMATGLTGRGLSAAIKDSGKRLFIPPDQKPPFDHSVKVLKSLHSIRGSLDQMVDRNPIEKRAEGATSREKPTVNVHAPQKGEGKYDASPVHPPARFFRNEPMPSSFSPLDSKPLKLPVGRRVVETPLDRQIAIPTKLIEQVKLAVTLFSPDSGSQDAPTDTMPVKEVVTRLIQPVLEQVIEEIEMTEAKRPQEEKKPLESDKRESPKSKEEIELALPKKESPVSDLSKSPFKSDLSPLQGKQPTLDQRSVVKPDKIEKPITLHQPKSNWKNENPQREESPLSPNQRLSGERKGGDALPDKQETPDRAAPIKKMGEPLKNEPNPSKEPLSLDRSPTREKEAPVDHQSKREPLSQKPVAADSSILQLSKTAPAFTQPAIVPPMAMPFPPRAPSSDSIVFFHDAGSEDSEIASTPATATGEGRGAPFALPFSTPVPASNLTYSKRKKDKEKERKRDEEEENEDDRT